MYLPKKENLDKLKDLYDRVDWNLEYDKLYLRNQKNAERKISINCRNGDYKIVNSNAEFLRDLTEKYNLHIKSGGTKFGFIQYLKEEYILFKCSTCQLEYHFDYISVGIHLDKINVGACSKCNTKHVKKWTKQKVKTCNVFRFKSNVRQLVSSSFKRGTNKFKKNAKTETILGCTIEEFRLYIESKFTYGMTLENYGKWHLDHIKPLALAKTEEEIVILNHYTNFQPLWAADNIAKGSKY